MKKFFLIFTVIIITMGTSSVALANDDHTSKNDQKHSFENQMIISIESENSIEKSPAGIMNNSNNLANLGFQVVDSVFDEDSTTWQAEENQQLKKLMVKEMGWVYLVEYNASDYKSFEEAESALQKALKDEGLKVRHISQNEEVYTTESTVMNNVAADLHPEQAWHYEMVNAPEAWDTTNGSSDVRVAVLDTGIDHNHQSLRDLVRTDLGGNFVGGSSTMDYQGHGTHVAGTVASYGSVSGVMQEATLIPVKVLGDDGSGSIFGIIEGVLHSVSVDADVINMSLGGGGYNQSFDDAVQTAVNAGTIVVAASGNEYQSSISYPAAYESVIAVGSVTSNKSRSPFSNYGNGLDLMAPGSNIYSTVPNNGYNSLSGTSMASPHVAGVAGLLRAADPDASVAEVRDAMNNTAEEVGSAFEYGNGIVDAYAAIQQMTDGDDGDNGDGGDGGDGDPPQAPEWQAYTFYAAGDEVTYNGQVYVCNYSHLSFPGWEPPNDPLYWSPR
ncbi:S8 family serine peptidase [Virgibacillus kimchii]